jgi:hypothetical protein
MAITVITAVKYCLNLLIISIFIRYQSIALYFILTSCCTYLYKSEKYPLKKSDHQASVF